MIQNIKVILLYERDYCTCVCPTVIKLLSCIFMVTLNNSYGLGRRKGLVSYNKQLQTLNGEYMHGSSGPNNNRFKKERICLYLWA